MDDTLRPELEVISTYVVFKATNVSETRQAVRIVRKEWDSSAQALGATLSEVGKMREVLQKGSRR